MVAPSTSALLTQWTWEPSVLLGIAALTGGYYYAVGPLRQRNQWGPPPTQTQITCFLGSVVVLIVALLSPLDAIGDRYLFSMHMVQHLLLATLWPPLILLAMPSWLVRAGFRVPLIAGLVGFFTFPAMGIMLFNTDIYAWHIPALYNLTLSNEWVHIGEHLSFMLFGISTWWCVLSPVRAQRLAYPLQTLYLFGDAMIMMVLGIIITFVPIVLYSPYAHAPRLWGLSALTDQQIGGLIMWYPGNIPYAVSLIVAFYRWFDAGGPTQAQNQRTASQSPTIGPPAS